MGKLAQAIAHGARLLQITGNFDDCLRLARELAESHEVVLVNSVNPIRLEGQRTIAYEVVDDLGRAPDVHVLPVGNAGNISAHWAGYRAYSADGLCALPRMWGFQAEGSAPIVLGHPVASPETVATAIRVGNPASWQLAVAARDESHGLIEAVTDDEILAAYRLLASREAVFCEPASAAGVAGLLRLHAQGRVDPGQLIVCTLTGNGLKDPQSVLASAPAPEALPATVEAAARALGLDER
jgi:threonine synthase